MNNIKPCPFCGRKRLKVEPLGNFGPVGGPPVIDLWNIDCKCGAMMVQNTKENTIKCWNRRDK